MSAHFDISTISFFALDEWDVAVCAWRGCCIEVFSRAEHSVADCLRAMEAAGVKLGKDARSPFASARIRALSACIKNQDFSGHEKAALKRLADWERVYETRAFLAHGEIKATPHGLTIRHITFDGKTEKQLAKHFSRKEMLETLAEMETAQRRLHSHLGQIKALAAKKALTVIPVETEPPGGGNKTSKP